MNPKLTAKHWLKLAIQHIHAAQWSQAEQACQQILRNHPLDAEAHHLVGHVYGQMGRVDESLAHMEQAIAIDPRHPQYRYNYAVSLGHLGRENEAAIQYQACLRQDPNHRDALWNYGEMLRLAEHFDLAAKLFERFAALGGNYPALHHRIAVTYGALHRDKEAEAHFLQEIKQGADPLTAWEYALFLLSRERFAEGFVYYRLRFQTNGRNSVYCHDFGLPLWAGQFVKNSTVLIHGEQGLGDEMMFASIVPEVLAKAKETDCRVILAVKPGLVRLFSASFPDAVVVAHRVGGPVADLAAFGQVDWQLPIGDLALLFRQKGSDFDAARRDYLFANSERAQWYAQHLAALTGQDAVPSKQLLPKARVGLMWGSNPAAVNAKFMRWSQQRSVPVQMFERLASLLPEVQFVSLQNAERGAEAALVPGLDILDLSQLQTDFLETASLIANLDLVISVDTSVSHLAGAMGKETWVPLIYRSDWRHGNKRKSSYWYANTRYFHQSEAQDWSPVLDEMVIALRLWLDQRPEVQKPMLQEELPQDTLIDSVKTDLGQALFLLQQRNFDQARPFFERALAAQPNNPQIQWEYAMQLLTEGQWGRGWDLHEARHVIFGAKGLNMCPLPWPQWQGEPLLDRAIVVHGEQGIGDEIMYLSMLPDLIATGARVILACIPSLVNLFQYSFPSIQVVSHPRGIAAEKWVHELPAWTDAKVIGRIDYQIPIASLGKHFRRHVADFPRKPYLFAEEIRVRKMAKKLEEVVSQSKTRDKPLLRIGLAWCGSLGDDNARARSVPLKQLQALIDAGKKRGCQFVSLQSRQYAQQAYEVPEFGLIDMSEYTDDFADLAALMVNLDLVISVDTSYAHLSAALGLPTWRMVIRNCDWRWGWGRKDSVWYADDTLFRQHENGNWESVVQKVAHELLHFKLHDATSL